MPLSELEAKVVAHRAAEIDAVIAACSAEARERRAQAVLAQLEAINGDWWDVHDADPGAYARDLARLNQLANWKNRPAKVPGKRPKEYAQVPDVERAGRRYLTPPKFFGGNPTHLAEHFVLAVSLNHARPRNSDSYVRELSAWQQRGSCFVSHRDYFVDGYVHEDFLGPRVSLLRAYTYARGGTAVPEDGRLLNQRYALYLEAYPTHSPRTGASKVPHDVVEKEVFVMALNALARKTALELLRPTAVLLAGNDAVPLLPSRAGPGVHRHPARPDPPVPCAARRTPGGRGPISVPCTAVPSSWLANGAHWRR
jgi:hypothetical protein